MTAKAERDDFDVVRAELNQLRADVQALGETLAKATDGLKGAARKKAERVVHDIEAGAEDAYEQIAEQGRRYANVLEQKISEHPLGTMALALAVGVVLGRLLDRSD
jgi:ElaB/YqjD/DUF883 family membrane-anchored ribosome-binding protein